MAASPSRVHLAQFPETAREFFPLPGKFPPGRSPGRGLAGWLWQAGYTLPATALLAFATTWFGARHSNGDDIAEQAVSNPLQPAAALQMAAIFQSVLMLVWFAGRSWGDRGIVGMATVLGLTDVDALTISMARRVASDISLETAAFAIAVGVFSNTVLKLTVALFFGGAGFRRVSPVPVAGWLQDVCIS